MSFRKKSAWWVKADCPPLSGRQLLDLRSGIPGMPDAAEQMGQALEATLSLNPRCSQAWYLAGMAAADGFDRAQAWDQLVTFGRMLGSLARRHNVTIVVEPLNRDECNVLNTVGESAGLATAVTA